jgi:hypothetical protein
MTKTRRALLWLLAFLLMAGTAVYQRRTGPTNPVRGTIVLGGEKIRYKLLRTQDSGEGLPVTLRGVPRSLDAEVVWKRHKTSDPPATIPLRRQGNDLVGALPSFPPAGKVEYQVRLHVGSHLASIPPDGPAVARYKGAVPAWALVPHILAMFTSLLIAMRVLLGALSREPVKRLAWWAFLLMCLGGGFLGPVVQKYAFGAFWTGWPFGGDLTDNKTAVMILAWLVALVGMRGPEGDTRRRWWAVGAALVVVAVYLIPHSMRGSEIKWDEPPVAPAPLGGAPR